MNSGSLALVGAALWKRDVATPLAGSMDARSSTPPGPASSRTTQISPSGPITGAQLFDTSSTVQACSPVPVSIATSTSVAGLVLASLAMISTWPSSSSTAGRPYPWTPACPWLPS